MTTEQQAREVSNALTELSSYAIGEAGDATVEFLVDTIKTFITQAAEDKRIADAVKWQPMDTCPINETVLLWNQDLEEISFGHKPEDSPDENAVVILMTASWADAWMPLPPEPESEPSDSDAPYLRSLPADAVGGGE